MKFPQISDTVSVYSNSARRQKVDATPIFGKKHCLPKCFKTLSVSCRGMVLEFFAAITSEGWGNPGSLSASQAGHLSPCQQAPGATQTANTVSHRLSCPVGPRQHFLFCGIYSHASFFSRPASLKDPCISQPDQSVANDMDPLDLSSQEVFLFLLYLPDSLSYHPLLALNPLLPLPQGAWTGRRKAFSTPPPQLLGRGGHKNGQFQWRVSGVRCPTTSNSAPPLEGACFGLAPQNTRHPRDC